ncbi:uncharacterized protein [Bemisia tabaci]|uniref:uncharacterized protein n=1 Tax=Bemisia tabaci TaxID=7038 RepID=UPI003B27DEA0
MIIFAIVIFFSTILSIFGVVKTKTNFHRLLAVHRILCRVDNQLGRPEKGGLFKYVAAYLIGKTAFLLALDCWVWKFTITEWWVFASSFMSRLMCVTILVQYENIVCNIKSRFYSINEELQQELANFSNEEDLQVVFRRSNRILPAFLQ